MKRNTQQRMAIETVFEKADHPLSPHDVLERAKLIHPGMGIATVYRAIRSLLDENQIVPVEVSGRPPLYERADLEHHHHFHCETCGEVTPLGGCSLNANYKLPSGFDSVSHEVLFRGTCAGCSDQRKPSSPRKKRS